MSKNMELDATREGFPVEGLAPCPHCGSAPQKVPQNSSVRTKAGKWWKFIWCETCDARGGERETEAEAIAAWNRRPPSPQTSPATEGEVLTLARSVIADMVKHGVIHSEPGRAGGYYVGEGVVPAIMGNAPAPKAGEGDPEELERVETDVKRLLAAEAECDKLREALQYARPLLVKYAHTQGNAAQFVREITEPVDRALSLKETAP